MSFSTRRTTADLVAELNETAAGHDHAALVIGFDHHTELVWASDPDPLRALNAHLRNGGDPLGLVTALRNQRGATSVRARPLAEYDGAEWVEKYLIELLAAMRRSAAARGIESGPITG